MVGFAVSGAAAGPASEKNPGPASEKNSGPAEKNPGLASEKNPGYDKDVRPLLVRYCFDCHAEGSSRGNVAFDAHHSAAEARADVPLWRRVGSVVRTELMPPAGKPQPTAAERAKLLGWIRAGVMGVDCRVPDPGHVTLRRLNRYEYNNTIHDLFGIDYQPAEDFPADDSGYGFDNIGEVLSLSPLLLDKYFTAAESVVKRVIADKPEIPSVHIVAAKMTTVSSSNPSIVVREAPLTVTEGGRFNLRLKLGVNSFNPFQGEVKVSVSVAGRSIVSRSYKPINRSYPFSVSWTLVPGDHVVRFVVDNSAVKPGNLPDIDFDLVAQGPIRPGSARYPDAHRRLFFSGDPPSDRAGRTAYAREILRRTAERAFRRPVDESTLDRLVTLAMASERAPNGFRRGIAQALQAILVSPRFLFRSEPPAPGDTGPSALIDEHALAARLSYFLWASLPDESLEALASAGQLRAKLHETVAGMVADPKSDRFVSSFVGQWLRTRDVASMTVNRRRFPGLSPAVKTAMRDETERLFAYIMREDRDVLDIIDANYTFVNAPLAALYQLPPVEGPAMRKVDLPADSVRGGVLTHGSFLLVTSNPTRTSPVKRGLYILENLLGAPPPPPPPNVPALEEPKRGSKQLPSARAQLEAHRANSKCANCHARMDPIGLALENFDVIGKWRDNDGGNAIDAHGKLPTGEAIAGVTDLRRVLRSRRPQFYENVARKLLTYALGRGLVPADDCAVDEIVARTMAGNGRFSALLLGLIDSPPFQQRRVDPPPTVNPT